MIGTFLWHFFYEAEAIVGTVGFRGQDMAVLIRFLYFFSDLDSSVCYKAVLFEFV